MKSFLPVLLSILPYTCVYGSSIPANREQRVNPKILILGGGVTGIIAARTLSENGLTNFLIIEGRDELGGRMRSFNFSGTTLEFGANWIQGTQTDDGPANPIYRLALEHNVKTHINNYSSMLSYDTNGAVDYLDVYQASVEDFSKLTAAAGARVSRGLVDITARSAYTLVGAKPKSSHAKAAEYFIFDWEYAQSPSQTSAISAAWNQNFTFDPSQGGFSGDNFLSVDQRGFKTLILGEANKFLKPKQYRLNSIVKTITRSTQGVKVTLADNTVISGDYALCTFSLGVLQEDDVKFEPELPGYKKEAIASMTMATYTKIFLKFPKKFWFDTEFALYADPERGRYPVWQSLDHPDFLPGSGILFVTVTGDYSGRVEALTDNQVKTEVLDVLQAMYPEEKIPKPVDFRFYRWQKDPLYRGSYSNWPPSFFKHHHDNLRVNDGRLYFAGEHTSQKYFGFLHGAYFEGLDMANHITRCVQHGVCNDLEHTKEVRRADS